VVMLLECRNKASILDYKAMLSAVRTVSCNTNQLKNLHLGSVLAFHTVPGVKVVIDPMN
jgi:hypothetical protein